MNMKTPAIRHIANLWTLLDHPSRTSEWSLECKLDAIAEAGFDGVCWAPVPGLAAGCHQRNLIFVGGMTSGDKAAFPRLLDELAEAGAQHVNVQLAHEGVLTPEALELTMALMTEAQNRNLQPAIESHRGTATETPEKLLALAEAYQGATGSLLPVSWDFSHFAVVKHLLPEQFAERLLTSPFGPPVLIQRAQHFHLRPFNGHHVQVPITDGYGAITPEVHAWQPFAEALLRLWIDGNQDTAREIFLCPELGPVEGGYALSSFPNSWEDAKVLRGLIQEMWDRAVASIAG